MTSPAAQVAAQPSTTARPADKGASQEIDRAVMRRAVDGISAVTGCRRAEARQQIRAWVAGGNALADLEAWLWQNFRLDPVGVTAVRNVARERGQR